jgi:colanic acid biosynthesis glycosyl transferase WcaI
MKQGIETIVEAAARVKEVRLIICGDGAMRPEIELSIASRAPGNVMLLPLQPDEDYRRMMADADVCVISQRAGTGAAFFPSKLLACVAFAKPVLAVADRESELARVVTKEGLGFSVAIDDIEEVAEVMRRLRGSAARLAECSRNGRVFAARFEEGRVLGEFESVLMDLVKSKVSVTPRAY